MTMAEVQGAPLPPGDIPESVPEDIAADVHAVGSIEAVPMLLQILCQATGMGFAAIARVTDDAWTACAVNDVGGFGVRTGGRLDVHDTFCGESRATGAPILIDHASADPIYRTHRACTLYKVESCVSVPIVIGGGRYFGNLCAMDAVPRPVADPKILAMFEGFAQLVAMQLDRHETRKLELELMRDERAVSELREQFIAILGHDLRNPLQAVFSGCAILQRKLTDPALRDVTGRIKASAARMSGLLNNVLDFARGRLGGGIGVDMRDATDVGERLQAVVNELQAANPARRIVAGIDFAGTVRCDPGRIQQVASNLIGNALTHGSADHPVNVTASVDDGWLTLGVWNAGEPIRDEDIPKIFEPFWRQRTSHDQGLGLGLFICAQIVRAHHGTIDVASTGERGTQFTVRIPLRG
jgi:signal transduction histidine kinase